VVVDGTHIGGQGLAAADGRTFAVHDKATGDVLTQYADGSVAEATAAVEFPTWAATAPRVRSEALHRAFELMVARTDELAALISAENGKALADARAEVT